MSLVSHLKSHNQGIEMHENPSSIPRPLPAFLRQVAPDTPRVYHRQAAVKAKAAPQSLSIKRGSTRSPGSLQSPRLHLNEVRVELTGVKSSGKTQAAASTSASAGELGVARQPGANRRSIQAARPVVRDTVPEVIHHNDRFVFEIEPYWDPDTSM